MAHKIAKLILEHSASFLERTEAVDAAISLGMTLEEIQEYLDWIDSMQGKKADTLSEPTVDEELPRDTPGNGQDSVRHNNDLPEEMSRKEKPAR